MIEDAIRKHEEAEVMGMSSDFKGAEFPGMTDTEIIEQLVKKDLKNSAPYEDNVMITQSQGYIIIDKEGTLIDGVRVDAF